MRNFIILPVPASTEINELDQPKNSKFVVTIHPAAACQLHLVERIEGRQAV
jgi:hypothetical protein